MKKGGVKKGGDGKDGIVGGIDRFNLAEYAAHLGKEFQLATLEPLPESGKVPAGLEGTAAEGGAEVEISAGGGEEEG